jgi:hypothetical protein
MRFYIFGASFADNVYGLIDSYDKSPLHMLTTKDGIKVIETILKTNDIIPSCVTMRTRTQKGGKYRVVLLIFHIITPSHMISFIGQNSSKTYMNTGIANNGRTKDDITADKRRGGKDGIFQAVENYRLTMQRRDDGDLPTHKEAHSEMSHQGIFQAVENYRLTMQLRDDGELPTFEDAHSEMSRKGMNNQVDDTRIAMQELVSAEVSSEMARSVHSAIMGTGNRGKPCGESTYRPSSILMIKQFVDPEFVTPTPESPDEPNQVFSQTNEDIAYALFQRGIVKATSVAQKKIASSIRLANGNLGPVKCADLVFQSRKHNRGTSYFIRFTVLEEIPPEVVEAPKRPDSDKIIRNNKVIKNNVDSDDDDNGGGGVTLSIAQVSSIKAARKAKKDAKAASWSDSKAKATSKKRTEAKGERSSTGKKTKNAKTMKWKVDDDEKEEWSPDDN